ncbi:MAG: sugar O-acetyltransferase [Alloprevotella sp.]|nr:sugar O-acetyltransferase [Alloprevotella sp.]
MTEAEKLRAGDWYNPSTDPELRQVMQQAQELTYDYNLLRPHQSEERQQLIRKILGRCGTGCCILSPFHCDYGIFTEVGDNFFMNKGCQLLDGGGITFGNNVFVGPMCGFHTAIHPLDPNHRAGGEEKALSIKVEDDVWIGAQVCVLPGVTIGKGSVIGAGSVVTRSIPPYSVAAGNPCRVIRSLEQPPT